eukprot:TRINITY_DN19162_c0_g2_i1.p1 TRINITY_DN19162_c0_g2~~TRINITY_DN19162_c0_g2_i1.p1  ORF type:complete len:444 (-),score=93.83 TRINITY_DN19162_c0_g2_i1:55-1281(-)
MASAAVPQGMDVVLAQFLADPARMSLELPPGLSSEERRCLKRLAEQHSELKCESFGLGKERQLHIFKRAISAQAPGLDSVRVKNTFIDDWGPQEEDSPVPVVFRSMPIRLPEMKDVAPGPPALSPIAEGALGGASPGGPIGAISPSAVAVGGATSVAVGSAPSMWASPDGSTSGGSGEASCSASSHASEIGPASPAPGSARELPGALEGLRVRNTFIHFPGGSPKNDRAVQSMPHGMFGRCVLEELGAAAHGSAEGEGEACMRAAAVAQHPAPVPEEVASLPYGPASPIAMNGVAAAAAWATAWLRPGLEVMTEGLVKLPAFNNLRGVVKGLDEASGRYEVLLEAATGPRLAKVKAENLRPAPRWEPPAYSPTVGLPSPTAAASGWPPSATTFGAPPPLPGAQPQLPR